jgi:hypothetical protein
MRDREERIALPEPGMSMKFYADDGDDKGGVDYLLFNGVVGYEPGNGTWYAIIDGHRFWHESDEGPASSN